MGGVIAPALAGVAMSKWFGAGQKASSGVIQGNVLATDNNSVGMRDAGITSHLFVFQAEDGIRDVAVTGVQTCALPISFSLRLVAIWRRPLTTWLTSPRRIRRIRSFTNSRASGLPSGWNT